MSEIEDLIQHALDQDYNKAGEVFGSLMGQKIGDALDQQKIALADQIYNGIEQVDNDDYQPGDEDEIQQQDDADFEIEDPDEEYDDDLEEDEED